MLTPLFAVYAVAFWVAATALSSYLGSRWSGWRDLSKLYSFGNPFEGRVWRFRSALLLRSSSFAWHFMVVNIGANEQGLYIKLFPVSMPFYPPLLVPWADLSAGPSPYWLKGLEIRFQKVNGLKLELRGRFGRDIAGVAGDAWPGGQAQLGQL